MADVCDLAADHMEAEAAHRAILHSRAAATRELTPRGRCHNPLCELDFEDEEEAAARADLGQAAQAGEGEQGKPPALKLFCNKGCSAEYETCKAGKRRIN